MHTTLRWMWTGLLVVAHSAWAASPADAAAPVARAEPALASSSKGERRVALVIGNSDYGAEALNLNSPHHDVALMQRALAQSDFDEVIVVENASRNAMIDALQRTRRQVADGTVVFYFSGHAINMDGVNWLLPTGERLKTPDDIALSAVSVPQVLRLFRHARLRVLILDACRTTPFSVGGKSVGGGGLGRDSLVGFKGTFISYAASNGSIAYDGAPGEPSPYTKALARNLMTPGIDLPNLFMNVRGDLEGLTAASPRGAQRSEEVSSLTQEHRFSFVESVDVGQAKATLAPSPSPSPPPPLPTASPDGPRVTKVGLDEADDALFDVGAKQEEEPAQVADDEDDDDAFVRPTSSTPQPAEDRVVVRQEPTNRWMPAIGVGATACTSAGVVASCGLLSSSPLCILCAGPVVVGGVSGAVAWWAMKLASVPLEKGLFALGVVTVGTMSVAALSGGAGWAWTLYRAGQTGSTSSPSQAVQLEGIWVATGLLVLSATAVGAASMLLLPATHPEEVTTAAADADGRAAAAVSTRRTAATTPPVPTSMAF